ncbi:MAG: 50S ribosomal protein L21 [Anaerolineales bacterium]|nr:50S ribosomal protein L21 [Anaerolineales bacterium]
MRYAIIESGGKQYKAVEGQAIEVGRLELEVGKKVELSEVLLVSDGETVLVGTPHIAGAKVAATVVAQDKGPKITVFKYKPKIRYRVKSGHRQHFTRLLIDKIDVKGGAKAEAKPAAAEPKAEAAPAEKKPTAKKPAAKSAAAEKKPAAKKPATKAAPKKK